MCGIYFSLSASKSVLPNDKTQFWLRSRGPDNFQSHNVQLELPSGLDSVGTQNVFLTFISTVLALRGDHVQPQPLIDADSQSVLCWNGEAWKVSGEPVEGNDTELIFKRLIEASRRRSINEKESQAATDGSLMRLTTFVSSITGPFSFVFYDGSHSRLFFSRDCLGRRSLLHGRDDFGNLKICSVYDGMSSASFEEVETDGLHMIDLSRVSQTRLPDTTGSLSFQVEVIPWSSVTSASGVSLKNPIPPMNRALPPTPPPALTLQSPCIRLLEEKLRRSLELRIQNVPQSQSALSPSAAKIAVLFSGGLDCTILARLAHDILPIKEPVDLLNVAFENPRVAAALAKGQTKKVESIYESCPDRVTGRAGHAELQRVCPGRTWRFVAVDVAYTEFTVHRDEVIQLMRPHNTEMDLSIACALYFASRGEGNTVEGGFTISYSTPARVLLSGLGADELFAGYGRHGNAFNRDGFQGLINEIDLDVSRLGKRNLGRDDRVISHWGREARFPYLDEEFVAWATQTPVWERCGFGTAKSASEDGISDDVALVIDQLDSEKKALRLVALKLGMQQVSREKKRAIQFGSRTAKMESGRSKGTQLLS